MKAELLIEPELEFGAGRHVDIRFGLKNHGPVTFDDLTVPKEINLGLIGTAQTIERVKDWLEHCRNGLPAKESKKPNLFPAFPGFGLDSCFRAEWVNSPKLEAAISVRELDEIIDKQPRSEGVPLLVECFIRECRQLCEKVRVDVLICAPPQGLFEYADTGNVLQADDDEQTPAEPEEESLRFDFHDMLKARGMQLSTPIQLIRPVTYDENVKEMSHSGRARQLQDPATCAWNFHTALYYKAGGTPWRLARSPSDFPSCFIGIGFYRSRDQQRVHTSVAQIFNERGQGMIFRGGEAYKSEDDRQLHLTRTEMTKLMKGVLGKFFAEWKHWPSRAVVHKTSLFNAEELAGCDDALREFGIQSRDLLTLRDCFIRLFRKGQYPPLRGTFVNFDQSHSILYTRGSIDFYQMYPGMYVPRTLEIITAQADAAAKTLAQEILALTKMNWNNTQFDAAFPITVKAARQVGSILRYLDIDDPIQERYAFYM
jgi:hypothetical protein